MLPEIVCISNGDMYVRHLNEIRYNKLELCKTLEKCSKVLRKIQNHNSKRGFYNIFLMLAAMLANGGKLLLK